MSRPAQYCSTIHDWARSDDAEHVEVLPKSVGRSHNVDIYRSRSTGRYLVRVWPVGSMHPRWCVADTLEGARAVRGSAAPQAHFVWLSAPDRVREVRALTAQIRAAGRSTCNDDDA